MSSEAERQAKIDRWNMYKSRVDSAGHAVIRATQFLVRPTEGFPRSSNEAIKAAWSVWRDEEECFYRMAQSNDAPPKRIFPTMPDVNAENCCYRMWGLLIQVQIDGTFGSTRFLGETAQEIAANEKCKSHPATCPCHVPDHPWIYKEDVDALAPLSFYHNPKCQCAGWQRCRSKEMAMAAKLASIKATQEAQAAMAKQAVAAPAPYSSPYQHNVDTCPCGNCHKSRVDSGTDGAYYKRCKEASAAALAALPAKMEADRLKRQESYQQTALGFEGRSVWGGSIGGMLGAAANADAVIAKALAASGGSTAHPDFAKNVFAAMGTPHDSTCPHGLLFYSCMPCSH